jgi:hypothetical protein
MSVSRPNIEPRTLEYAAVALTTSFQPLALKHFMILKMIVTVSGNVSDYVIITITILDIIQHPIFYLKTAFCILDSVSVFRWNLLNCAQPTELVHVSGHQQRQ